MAAASSRPRNRAQQMPMSSNTSRDWSRLPRLVTALSVGSLCLHLMTGSTHASTGGAGLSSAASPLASHAAQLIQRRCEVCGGSGLVRRGVGQRKCPQCGGFFPWISWRQV